MEWLGDVPEHWSITPLKFAIKNWRNGKWGYDVVEASDDNLVCVRVADFDRQKGVINTEKLTLRNYKGERVSDCLLNENHILIERSGGGENQLVGATVKFSLNIKAVCSNFISLLEIKTNYFDLDFIQYYFDHLYSLNVNKLSIKQTSGIQNLDLKQYVQNHISFPEIFEQTQIVSFLDTETTRIDTLIAKQEKLIELLEEQRKSIISHAVTKGLNPNALMKDSGVEWLGRVPCDWQYYSIKRTIKVLTDYTANGSFADLAKNVNYLDYGFSRLVRLTDLREDLNNNGVYITEDAHKYLKKSELFGGELLLANVGAYAGFACLMPYKKIKATLAPNMFLLRFKEQRINNKFMYYLINSKTIQYQFQVSMTSTAQPKLNKDNVKNIVMFLPTLQIQNEIVEYLDSENLILDNLIFKQQALIEKLKEYRASIISHAVTGKIDVREHMA